MKTFLILNTAEIVKKVTRHRYERNLYEKVNNFIKRGANSLHPELLAEVQDIINIELDTFNNYCAEQLQKIKTIEADTRLHTAV